MPAKKTPRAADGAGASAATEAPPMGERAQATDGAARKAEEKPKPEPRTFPAGTYVLRMDQPYSRIADTLLDYQYWAPNDPQKSIYDDTGWTFGELSNVQVARVTDVKVLDAAMTRVEGPVKAPGGVENTGSIFLINHNADHALVTLRYRFPQASFEAAEEPFEAAGRKFNRGSFIVRDVSSADLAKAGQELGIEAYAVDAAPQVKTHPLRAARVALMHTWTSTQHEGWWRMEFDRLKVPYDYISVQTVCRARRSALAVRCDCLSARRPRQPAGHRQRHADVRQSAALESDAAHAQPGQDGRDRRHAAGDGLDGPGTPAGIRAPGRPADCGQRHQQFRRHLRPYPGRQHRGGAAT